MAAKSGHICRVWARSALRRSRHKVTGLQGLTAESPLKYQILGVHARYKAL
jgi:hypothetical protein